MVLQYTQTILALPGVFFLIFSVEYLKRFIGQEIIHHQSVVVTEEDIKQFARCNNMTAMEINLSRNENSMLLKKSVKNLALNAVCVAKLATCITMLEVT